MSSCESQYPGGVSSVNALLGSSGCAATECQAECLPGDAGSVDSGTSDPWDSQRDTCVSIINQYRAQVGAPALVRARDMEACADAQAEADAVHNQPHWAYFNNSPSCILDNVTDRQNECPNYPDPPSGLQQCFAQMYAEGPGGGHYDVMLDPSYTRVACGFYQIAPGNDYMPQNYYAE